MAQHWRDHARNLDARRSPRVAEEARGRPSGRTDPAHSHGHRMDRHAATAFVHSQDEPASNGEPPTSLTPVGAVHGCGVCGSTPQRDWK